MEWGEYVVTTPTGFVCNFCSKEYDRGSGMRLYRHLAKVEFHDVDNCPLVPVDVRNRLHQGLQNCRKRDSTLTNQCIPSGKRAPLSTIGVPLFTTKLVGKQFEGYIKDIWSCLMDGNNVFRIGIHGIGGIGKTQVAKYINNILLRCPNKFGHVFWVSMSPDWSSWNRYTGSPLYRVRDLQSCVSKAVGVGLSDGDDESKRAAQLSKGLAEKKKSVLILDDVWDYINLQEVGIPVGVDGCTVVFTTRSLGVCRELGCQRKIEIKGLLLDESCELFKEELGKETTLSREVEEILRLVVCKCAGVPHAITIMARKMKGITDKSKWRNALGGQMHKKADMEIFQKLKTSYDYLNDMTLQHCFLFCAPVVEQLSRKRELAEYLVDEGIIKNMNSRREELDEALTILDFLCDAGLLEIRSGNSLGMNGLIRSMARQIMEESQPRVMVINEESWTEDLVRVKLDCSKIENIPCNYSPSCSNLSTLVLSRNRNLKHIGDSFFEGMPGLKVLILSRISIESLPASVCGLVNLTTLVLSWCLRLKNIPSLAKLKKLKKLDLSCTAVEKVPEDIGALSKLTYLDLYDAPVNEFNSEILANFNHLRFFRLPCECALKGEAVARLGRLETLECSFADMVEFNNSLIHLKEREPPLHMRVQVGGISIHFCNRLHYYGTYSLHFELHDDWSVVALENCDINETTDVLNNVEDILILNCYGARSLCEFSPIKGPTKLKHFAIQKCDELEFLSVTGQGVVESIEFLELYLLENLSVLVKKEGDVAYGSSCFSNLTRLLIQGCPSIKRLFPSNVLPNLKNLQRLFVVDCAAMEEIFGAEEEEEGRKIVEKKICCLQKLSILWLVDLPMLKRFCGGGAFMCGVPKRCSIRAELCPIFGIDGVGVYDI